MTDTTTDLANYNPSTGEVIEDNNDNGALAIREMIQDLQTGNIGVYSTIVGDDFSAKVQVLQAVTRAEKLKPKNIDKHIDLVNVVVQEVVVNVTDPKTKETDKVTQPRVILIDRDGTAYYGISIPLLNAVKTFIGILGQPHTWPSTGVGTKVEIGTSRSGYEFYNMIFDFTKGDPTPVVVAKK